jgi:filamin
MGLVRGEINQTNEFNIYTREAGAGALAIAVEGPAKAEIDFHDHRDGTCGVSYVCPAPGEYQVAVKFNDEHIPESPFAVSVSPHIGDARKLTIHSLQHRGHQVDKACTFSVNVNGAKGKLDAQVTHRMRRWEQVQAFCRQQTNSIANYITNYFYAE